MEKVFRWQALIDSGKFSNVHELARVIGKDDGYVSLIIRLAAGEILPLFLFSIQKWAWPSKRKSEPFGRIILRVYYGVVVVFISEEKSCMTLFTISK